MLLYLELANHLGEPYSNYNFTEPINFWLFVGDATDNYKSNKPNSYVKHSYTHGLQPIAIHNTFRFPCSVLLIARASASISLKAKFSCYIGVERYDILQAVNPDYKISHYH